MVRRSTKRRKLEHRERERENLRRALDRVSRRALRGKPGLADGLLTNGFEIGRAPSGIATVTDRRV